MTRSAKHLLATLVLIALASTAASASNHPSFRQRVVTGYYGFAGTHIDVGLTISLYMVPSKGLEGVVGVYIADRGGASNRILSAGGKAPLSALKITGQTITVNLPNLRDLVGPDFELAETGFHGPIPMKCTIAQTDSWKVAYTQRLTERVPQADGKTLVEKSNQNSTGVSAFAEGVIADYELPLSDPLYGYTESSLGKGDDFKLRFPDELLVLRRATLTSASESDPRVRTIQGSYGHLGSHLSFNVGLTLKMSPSGTFEAHVSLGLVDWGGASVASLSADGKVPLSLLKVTGQTISIDIPDVRALVGPDFHVFDYGFPGPIPLRCSIAQTSSWREDTKSVRTERVQQEDGKVTIQKRIYSYTDFSASVAEGVAADYKLPFSDTADEYSTASIKKGNWNF